MIARALILSDHDRREDFRRWGMAAAIVVAAHFGLVATYLLASRAGPQGSPLTPAVIIELAPMAVAPSTVDDLPGPQISEETPPPQEMMPQVEPKVEAVPQIEAPAEVLLPKPEPKPVEQKPLVKPEPKRETKKVERKPPTKRETASRADRVADRPSAPSPGSEASRAAIASWRDQVVARLQSVKRYPSGADGSGTVLLAFTVNRSGAVIGKSITRGSGNHAFDEEALAMVSRASPFPPVPDAIRGSSVHLPIPINFTRR